MSEDGNEETYRRLLEYRLGQMDLKIEDIQRTLLRMTAEIAGLHVKASLLGLLAGTIVSILGVLLQRL